MKSRYLIIGIVVLLLYYLPVIILGEDSYLMIHDNLDGEFIQRLIVSNSQYNGVEVIPQIFNGLPIDMVSATKWNVTTWLFDLFSPFTAYIVNDFLARIIGFVSMMLLLDLVLTEKSRFSPQIMFACSLIFAFIGNYTIYNGLTLFGQPLILWIFLKLSCNEFRWWYYAMLALFTIWSSFALSGICIMLGIWWVVIALKGQKWHWPFFVGLLVLCVGYVLVEHKILLSFLSEATASHRSEFVQSGISLRGLIKQYLFDPIFITQYHAGVIYTLPIIVLVAFGLSVTRRIEKKEILLIFLIGAVILVGLIYRFAVINFGTSFPLLNAFQWDRFYFLLPMAWIVLLGICLSRLMALGKRWICIVAGGLTVICFVGVAYGNNEFRQNSFRLLGRELSEPSYCDFFDRELFSNISDHIGVEKSQYRVISLGMHPSVAQFNGFFTLDSYQVSYPLSYKREFRQIIAAELNKSADLRSYFDNWGSRCYLFSHELGSKYLVGRNSTVVLRDFELNTAKLYQMGGRYLFSAVEISNYQDINLLFEGVFEGRFWKVYLYQISPNNEQE